MAKLSSKLLGFKRRQKHGAIMKPSTFKAIERKATKTYGSAKIGKAVAGAAYQKTLRAKYRKRKG